MSSINALIAATIRDRRKEASISGTKMARLLGMTHSAYYRLENGDREISAAMLLACAKILNFSIDAILDPELRGLPKGEQIMRIMHTKAAKLDLVELLKLNDVKLQDEPEDRRSIPDHTTLLTPWGQRR